MYKRFGLTLMVTQACNLKCRYCYVVSKNSYMAQEVAEKAVLCAVRSINCGGLLELGFFGGEPFLACQRIISVISFAKKEAAKRGIVLTISITTNGTILNADAWTILDEPQLHLSISVDGKPKTHDRNRCFLNGDGSSEVVERNVRVLLQRGVKFRVVTVVNPETVEDLDGEIRYLHQLGCNDIELSLDVWSSWNTKCIGQLENSISRCARLWYEGLPGHTLSWFDDKAVQLTNSTVKSIPCGFGKGDIAVTPSGHLYPCERLIENDSSDNPMRLQDDIFNREDFLFGPHCDLRTPDECLLCAIKSACNTTCGCCNYVRTGEIGRPDRLLCLFNQWCLNETKSVLESGMIPLKGEQ